MENGILIKSEKIPLTRLKLFYAAIAIIFLLIIILNFTSDYNEYKEGQAYALSFLEKSGLISSSDSYEEQCAIAYRKFTYDIPNTITIKGVK